MSTAKSGSGVDQEGSTTRTEAPASDPVLTKAYLVAEYDYDNCSHLAVFTSRAGAAAFIASGPEEGRPAFEIEEINLNPVSGCFYTVMDFDGRKINGRGWTYRGIPETREEFVGTQEFVYGATQERADTLAGEILAAAPPMEWPHYDKASDFDERVGCAWVLDASGRVWTHPSPPVMDGSIKTTRLYGPAPFDYLSRRAIGDRSGWLLLAESLEDLTAVGT